MSYGDDGGVFGGARRIRDSVRRAFAEFLAIPTCTIASFLLLAGAVYALDRLTPEPLAGIRRFLEQRVFIDSSTTSDLLAAIASGVITVTSITISVLLLAVQQSAASMTSSVFDQFLRRRLNQFYFGFFIGLALYTLMTLATVHENSNAVFGATLAFALTVAGLYLLIVLLYSTVDQMRPVVVIGSISRLTMVARHRQRTFLARVQRKPTFSSGNLLQVTAKGSGYVTRIELDGIGHALSQAPASADTEVVLHVTVGSYVSFGDAIGEVGRATGSADRSGALTTIAGAVRRAVHLEEQRDIAGDPSYGIEQIHTIGWTSISSAKSNPDPGLFAIRTLRDLLVRWGAEEDDSSPLPPSPRILRVVYVDDTVARLFDALESLAVAASESRQHQCLAEVLRTVDIVFPRLPPEHKVRARELVERIMPTVDSHVFTALLEGAISSVRARLTEAEAEGAS